MALAPLVEELFTRPSEEGISLALVVQHRGSVIGERYGVQPANDFQPEETIHADSTLVSWSTAKSITHAAVGVLVRDGLVDVEAPAPVPEWAGTDKEAITLLQLLEMRSGLHFVEDYVDGDVSNCIEMLFGDSGPSHAAYAAAQPLAHAPGTCFNYSSGTTNIVCRIIGDVLGAPRDAPAQRREAVTDFLHSRLFGPAGMSSAIPKFDDAGDFVGSSFVFATARDFARFGELYAFDGVAGRGAGERILPEGWLDHARTWISTDPESGAGYGRHWWMSPALEGAVVANGYEGQRIIVWPEHDLVVVHLGKTDVAVAPALDERLLAIVEAALG